MAIRVVRLGSPRHPKEGLRIGTVRRPPRGVPKAEFSSGNWYDVWFPVLAPSVETMKLGQAAETPAQWTAFARKYRGEMAEPARELRRSTCWRRCRRRATSRSAATARTKRTATASVLRALLAERGASIVT